MEAGDLAGLGGAPKAAPEPEAPAPRTRERAGEYVILYSQEGELFTLLAHDGNVASYGGGQQEAKKAAIADERNGELRQLVATDGAIVVAIPFSSWKPTTARIQPAQVKLG